MSFHPHMIEMLERNEEWAQGVEDKDPDFFPNSARGQNPHTLWIGCADSRVPESVITAAMPGDIFVNRNIGNQVHLDDNNMLAVLTFAIEHLNVNHVVVCGHSNCGAAAASLEASSSVVPGKTPITIPTDAPDAPLNVWLAPLTVLAADLQSFSGEALSLDAFIDGNVRVQVNKLCSSDVIKKVWANDQRDVWVHGLVHELSRGRLRDLGISRGPVGPYLKEPGKISTNEKSAKTIDADWRGPVASVTPIKS